MRNDVDAQWERRDQRKRKMKGNCRRWRNKAVKVSVLIERFHVDFLLVANTVRQNIGLGLGVRQNDCCLRWKNFSFVNRCGRRSTKVEDMAINRAYKLWNIDCNRCILCFCFPFYIYVDIVWIAHFRNHRQAELFKIRVRFALHFSVYCTCEWFNRRRNGALNAVALFSAYIFHSWSELRLKCAFKNHLFRDEMMKILGHK